MTLSIERDRLYRLRNGEIVRVVCVDGYEDRPIYGYAIKCGMFYSWHSNGAYKMPNHNSDIVAEHREPREFWLQFADHKLNPVDYLDGRYGKPGNTWSKFREVLE